MANIEQFSEFNAFEGIEYRYPVFATVDMQQINSFDQMVKKAKKGTYVCSECLNLTGDYVKSAVYLRGGTKKQCLHISHYKGKSCNKEGDSPLHNAMKKAYATYFGGKWEDRYPNSTYGCDARVKDTYYEFEKTSKFSPKKKEFVQNFVRSNGGVVLILDISKFKKDFLKDLWGVWLESKRNNDNLWCSYWYINTNEFLTPFNVRTYQGKKEGVAKINPNGTVDVGHMDSYICDISCPFFQSVEGDHGQMALMGKCNLYEAHGSKDVWANCKCEFDLGVNKA